jgi:peptide/nickel transport system permease protein
VVVVPAARLAIMAIVGSLYVMNVGLDEVFNPRLRNM